MPYKSPQPQNHYYCYFCMQANDLVKICCKQDIFICWKCILNNANFNQYFICTNCGDMLRQDYFFLKQKALSLLQQRQYYQRANFQNTYFQKIQNSQNNIKPNFYQTIQQSHNNDKMQKLSEISFGKNNPQQNLQLQISNNSKIGKIIENKNRPKSSSSY